MRVPNLFRFAGLGLAAPVAVVGDWSLPEFCWSTWLAGLLFTWLCVLTGGLQIVLRAGEWSARFRDRVPALARLSRSAQLAVTVLVAGVATAISFRAYSFLFGFYGLFLSFFAEMEPHSLFGRNGFINSDFWTPVQYLAATFWAMCLGTVVAFGREIARSDPWKRLLLPMATEVVRVHIMVVVMPFIALLAWAVLGDAYQPVVIVLLMAAFYLLPGRARRPEAVVASAAAERGSASVSVHS